MDKLRRTIVLSGEVLNYCAVICHNELFEEHIHEAYAKRSENVVELPCLTHEVIRDVDLGLRGAMTRVWSKRAVWLAKRIGPDAHFRIWVGMGLAYSRIRDDRAYRISSRWTSSLLTATTDGQWPGETEPASVGVDERLDESPKLILSGYLDWGRLGGHPDLPRWFAMYELFHRDGQLSDFDE